MPVCVPSAQSADRASLVARSKKKDTLSGVFLFARGTRHSRCVSRFPAHSRGHEKRDTSFFLPCFIFLPPFCRLQRHFPRRGNHHRQRFGGKLVARSKNKTPPKRVVFCFLVYRRNAGRCGHRPLLAMTGVAERASPFPTERRKTVENASRCRHRPLRRTRADVGVRPYGEHESMRGDRSHRKC